MRGHHLIRPSIPAQNLGERAARRPRTGNDAVSWLQRTAGNRAVASTLASLAGRVVVQRFTASKATAEEHQQAISRHGDDRKTLQDEIERLATSQDVLERNTARWFQLGRSELFALTPTADTAQRTTLADQDRGMLAMFGGSNPVLADDNRTTYDTKDASSTKNLMFVPENSGGFRVNRNRTVHITQPARRALLNAAREAGAFDPVSDSLKHETQHEADIDYNVESAAARDEDARALATYRTEFRAYTAQGPAWLTTPLEAKDEKRLEELGVQDRTWKGGLPQQRIFLQVVGEYEAVAKAWRHNGADSNFGNAVLAMCGPLEAISRNPQNSPEVDALWSLLTASTIHPENKEQLVAAANAVSATEREAILQAESLWGGFITEDWQQADVRHLLSGRFDEFGVERRQAEDEKRRRREKKARERAPKKEHLKERFTEWPQVRRLLDGAVLDAIQARAYDGDENDRRRRTIKNLEDEYTEWRDSSEKPSGLAVADAIEIFFGNTFSKDYKNAAVNWWDFLE